MNNQMFKQPSIRGLSLVAIVLVAVLAIIYGPRLAQGRHPFIEIIDDPGGLLNSYPWGMYAAEKLRMGMFPLWNPYSGTGIPLLANYQSAVLFPLHIIYYVFPNALAFDFLLALRMIIIGLTFWWFLKGEGLSAPASLAGAVGFAFCGYFMRLSYMVHINVEMLLPLSLIVVRGLSKNPGIGHVLTCSVTMGLALLGGNPQSVIILVLFMIFMIFTRASSVKNMFRALVILAMSIGIGGLVSFGQTLPFAEAVSQSWHVHEVGHGFMHSPISSFFSLFAPWMLGPIREPAISTAFMPYIGATIFTLAIVGIINLKKLPKHAWGYAAFAIFFLGLGYGLEPFVYIQSLPVLARSVLAKYAHPAVVLCLTALAAHAVDLIASKRVKVIKPISASIIIILAASLLPYFMGFDIKIWHPAFAMGIVILLLLVWLFTHKSKPMAFAWAAALLVAVGVVHDERGLKGLNIGTTESTKPEKTIINILNNNTQARFISSSTLMKPNLNLLQHASEFQIFEALYPERYVKLMSRLLGFEIKDAVKYFDKNNAYFPLDNYLHESGLFEDLFASLGITDIVSAGYYGNKTLSIKHTEVGNADLFYIPININFINKPKKALNILSTKPYKMSDTAYIESGKDKTTTQETPEVKMLIGFDANMEKRVYRIENRGKSTYMVIKETYYPGWRAFIDGVEAPILKANWLFMAVELPAKSQASILELRYEPHAFRIGLYASLTSVFFIFAALFIRPERNSL